MNVTQFRKAGTALVALLLVSRASADTLVHETIVDAPVADVWNAFTDAEEIVTWMVPKADVDMRVGGLLRTTYNPDAALDGPEAIHQKILAYEPEKMIAFQVVKCPQGFEYEDLVEQAWEVIYFTALGPDRTHLRAAGCGYKTGGQWDDMRAFFDQGNAWTYEQLKKKFAEQSADDASGDAEKVLQVLSQLVGGEWIHESETPEGGVFRVRHVLQHGPDGTSVIGRGWLGDETGMFEHGSTHAYLDPVSRQVRFFNINEHGAIAEGAITLHDERSVVWDWRIRGTEETYNVLMTFTGPDNYMFTLRHVGQDGSLEQVVQIIYDRVRKAPNRFLELRNDS